jgi:hypothetical protein
MAIAKQAKNQKFLSHKREIVGITAIILPIFLLTTMALLGISSDYRLYWLWTPKGLLTILGLDVVWFIIIKLWNFKRKISLTILFYTLSAAIFTCWVIVHILSYL